MNDIKHLKEYTEYFLEKISDIDKAIYGLEVCKEYFAYANIQEMIDHLKNEKEKFIIMLGRKNNC